MRWRGRRRQARCPWTSAPGRQVWGVRGAFSVFCCCGSAHTPSWGQWWPSMVGLQHGTPSFTSTPVQAAAHPTACSYCRACCHNALKPLHHFSEPPWAAAAASHLDLTYSQGAEHAHTVQQIAAPAICLYADSLPTCPPALDPTCTCLSCPPCPCTVACPRSSSTSSGTTMR